MKKICLALVLVLLMVSVGWATDWYVRPAGGNYGTEDGTSYENAWEGFSNIVWGAGGVQAGDTLWLDGNATYNEQLTVGASGTEGNYITIRGDYGGGKAVISCSTDHNVVVANQSYLVLKHLATEDSPYNGFYIYASGTGVVEKVQLNDLRADNCYHGICLERLGDSSSVSNVQITDVIVVNNKKAGITFGGVDNCTVKHALVYNNNTTGGLWGVYAVGHYTSEPSGWTLYSGTIYYKSVTYTPLAVAQDSSRWLIRNEGNYGSLQDGEWDYNSGNLYVNIGQEPSDVYENKIYVVIAWSTNIKLESIVSCNNQGTSEGIGIGFDLGVTDSTIERCISYNNRSYGFQVMFNKNTTIAYCLAYSSTYHGGINIRNNHPDSHSYIINCTTVDNTLHGIGAGGQGTTTVKNCLSYNNGTDEFSLFGSETLDAGYNCNGGGTYNSAWEAAKGSNNVEQDPLLTPTYHLTRNSPCIDAGTQVTGIHDQDDWKDLDGHIIHYGSNPDIGCYEYNTNFIKRWGKAKWNIGKWGRGKWGGARW